MEKIVIEVGESLYREPFQIHAFRFGKGKKALCIVGALRGDEYQQAYICSLLVQKLKEIEEEGFFKARREILVIPCANPYSLNEKKRFWAIGDVDLNQMFPGYANGGLTQQIADGIFQTIKDYHTGIQFCSPDFPESNLPYVEIYSNIGAHAKSGADFGLPFVIDRKPVIREELSLHVQWCLNRGEVYAIYPSSTQMVNHEEAREMVEHVVRYLVAKGIVNKKYLDGRGLEHPALHSAHTVQVGQVHEIRCKRAGFFVPELTPGDSVKTGDLLARITDVNSGRLLEEIKGPMGGQILSMTSESLLYAHTVVYRIVAV